MWILGPCVPALNCWHALLPGTAWARGCTGDLRPAAGCATAWPVARLSGMSPGVHHLQMGSGCRSSHARRWLGLQHYRRHAVARLAQLLFLSCRFITAYNGSDQGANGYVSGVCDGKHQAASGTRTAVVHRYPALARLSRWRYPAKSRGAGFAILKDRCSVPKLSLHICSHCADCTLTVLSAP